MSLNWFPFEYRYSYVTRLVLLPTMRYWVFSAINRTFSTSDELHVASVASFGLEALHARRWLPYVLYNQVGLLAQSQRPLIGLGFGLLAVCFFDTLGHSVVGFLNIFAYFLETVPLMFIFIGVLTSFVLRCG